MYNRLPLCVRPSLVLMVVYSVVISPFLSSPFTCFLTVLLLISTACPIVE